MKLGQKNSFIKRAQMRRIAVALAVVGTLTAALAGCSSTNGGTGSSPDTLTIWSYVDAKNPYMQQMAADFKKSHPNVTLKYLNVGYDALTNKLIAAASTRTGPDVIIYDPANTASLVSAGALSDLTKSWGGFSDKSQFPEYATWKVNGKIYGTQAYVNTTALYYNQDLLQKAGITAPPVTFDELSADLKQVVSKGMKGIAQCGAPTSECETQAAAWILGGGGNYNNFASSETKKVFANWYQLGKDGALGSDSVTWTQGDAWTAFAKGNYAFTQNGNWNLSAAKDLTFKWAVAPLPGGKVAPGGEGEAIGAFSKNQALAWGYLSTTMLSKEGQLQILKAAGSIPTRIDAQSDPAVTSDQNIQAWVTELKDTGHRSEFVNPSDYLKATTAVGAKWSALRQGSTSPEDASQTLVSSLKGTFK